MQSSPAARPRTQRLRLAGLYFGMVFGVGFLLGSIRVPFLVPRFGARYAELLEMPLMLLALYWAAGLVVRRYRGEPRSRGLAIVGMLALVFLVLAELLLAVVLSGRQPGEYLASRDPVSGTVYLLMLIVFAAMPWWRDRRDSAGSQD